MDKVVGRYRISFKVNDNDWHTIGLTSYLFEEPSDVEIKTFSFTEFLETELFKHYFELVTPILPWNKEYIRWSMWSEYEIINSDDIITTKYEWETKAEQSFKDIMEKLPADDFIEYCKCKGLIANNVP